jgi:2-iminobutanoate/2-iminopropanoate deaminase
MSRGSTVSMFKHPWSPTAARGAILLALFGGIAIAAQDDAQTGVKMKKSFVHGTWQKSRAFSPAVITEGGKIIWIAGHGGQKDTAGNSLAGDFDAQVRQAFKNIDATLKEAGASLKAMVTMTVFLADARYTTRMTEIRAEIFGDDFPASAAITVTGFADPSMLIEIQGVAVVR